MLYKFTITLSPWLTKMVCNEYWSLVRFAFSTPLVSLKPRTCILYMLNILVVVVRASKIELLHWVTHVMQGYIDEVRLETSVRNVHITRLSTVFNFEAVRSYH